MGAAEISALFKEYAGSYVMTFAGYNAGRGRVRQWVAQHGDPRDPNVDEVDWVERIPISETRNYVQRVMENLQMYGVRLGASVATVEPNLHRAASVERRRSRPGWTPYRTDCPASRGPNRRNCRALAESRNWEARCALCEWGFLMGRKWG